MSGVFSHRDWAPTRFRRFIRNYASSTGPAEVLTDAGYAFVKALGNREGPHVLACEWIATSLADWIGLQTFDYSILRVGPDDEILLGHGVNASPGPAFATRSEKGMPWSGHANDLKCLENPDDIAGLVLFDTWTRNCDRHHPESSRRRPNYDNVFLSQESCSPGRFTLKAMDHSHCFTCGGDLTPRVAQIDVVQDNRIYGLFPEFRDWITEPLAREWVRRLRGLDRETAECIVEAIPEEWEVPAPTRAALTTFIVDRAWFVTETFIASVEATCDW